MVLYSVKAIAVAMSRARQIITPSVE